MWVTMLGNTGARGDGCQRLAALHAVDDRVDTLGTTTFPTVLTVISKASRTGTPARRRADSVDEKREQGRLGRTRPRRWDLELGRVPKERAHQAGL